MKKIAGRSEKENTHLVYAATGTQGKSKKRQVRRGKGTKSG